MYTPEYKDEMVIIYDRDGEYALAQYLGEKGKWGEHFKCQRIHGPKTTEMLHYEDIYKLNDENRQRYLN